MGKPAFVSRAVALLALFVAVSAGAQAPAVQPTDDGIETLLVSGEQSGPGLWKVSRGNHVLWILGSPGALPEAFVWKSAEVERRVAESQQVLYTGTSSVGVDIGLLRGLTLLPSMLKAAKNPGGAKLADVLPPQTHAKWRQLKAKYLGDDDGVERWRPSVALGMLEGAAFWKSGLSLKSTARAVVERTAKKHRVPVMRPDAVKREVHVEDPRGQLKRVAKREIDDVACFERGLDALESRLADARAYANAWATGDLDALRAWHDRSAAMANARRSCEEQMLDALGGEPGAAALVESLRAQADVARRAAEWNWLRAARTALEENESTFALLPMDQLLDADGYVAKLRAEGYVVAEP